MPFRVDVARRRDADGAGAGRPEIRKNVAEQVRADHDVEPVRMQHEIRGENVDVIFVPLYLGVVFGHRLDAFVPIRHGDRNAVGLRRRGQVLLGPRLRQFERELQDAIDADPGHHGLLRDEFAVGIGKHPPADRGIFAFGVFAHHPEIDIAGFSVGQRRRHARHQPHRPEIDVLVELPAKLYQRTPQGNVIRDLRRPADRAEIDRVVLADFRLPVLRHHLAVLFVIIPGREIEMVEMQADAMLPCGLLQHAQSFRHHFLADAVTGNDRDPVLLFFVAHREIPCALPAGSAGYLIGLQWTKVCHGATLHCNVDGFCGRSLTVELHRPPNHTSPHQASTPMDLHLRRKRVLITGASKGIGAAAAEAFAEEGCHLRLAARSGDQLKALAERLRSAHQIDATVEVVDLRKPEDIARLAKDASDIDILVNNAGDIPGGSIDKIDEPTWRHAWELKVFGYINITRAIYAQMKARGHGVIVNDIGAAGERFDANYICGSAGNAAIMAFTRALGGKSPADNIRVVGINPGPVGPDRHITLLKTRAKNQFGDENRYKEFQKGLPLGRPAHAREIGDLMAFLASDRSGYTSGVIFTVDGGIAAGWG